MENPFSSTRQESFRTQTQKQLLSEDRARTFMRQVYTTMALGLAITGLTAWFVANNEALVYFFFSGIMKWIVLFAPLAIFFYVVSRLERMSFNQASIAFALYSLTMGITFSVYFFVFDVETIWRVFLITAGTFGAMSLVGLTTKIDLSQFRSVLIMGLIGVAIALVVNLFLASENLDYIISIVAVLVFSGLIAYKSQNLMELGSRIEHETDNSRKMALFGAFTLYLSFINLFIFMLRLFAGGGRNE